MIAIRRIAALARADLRERTRRPAFLVALGAGLWAAWVFSPPNGARWTTFEMSGHRGLYGSAWLGAATAILTIVFFSLIGFYLVKNAVQLDRTSGTGPLLATTPTSKAEYLLGKWLANTAYLAAMVGVIAIGAAGMQIVRAEDPHLRPLVLLAPFVFVTLPALVLVSAVAVLFEAAPFLSGGFGNFLYFFVWIGGLVGGDPRPDSIPAWDPLGVRTLTAEMMRGVAAVFADARAHPERMSIGLNFRDHGAGWHLTTFDWAGVHWTAGLLLPRLAVLAAAAGIVLLAAIPFDRFAHGAGPQRRRGPARGPRDPAALEAEVEGQDVALLAHATALAGPVFAPSRWPEVERRFDALALVRAELRLLFTGTHLAWWLVAAGSVLVTALTPRDVDGRLAAFGWIWPALHWSALGARDRLAGTTALLDSSPAPLGRQLPAAWLAGAIPALGCGAVFATRSLAAGDPAPLAGALAGAAFVPALALLLGTLTGGRKTFEIVYVVLWYVGPLNGGALLDFTGGSGGRAAIGFAAAALAALALTALSRARRLAHA